jgi:hypothetical protein
VKFALEQLDVRVVDLICQRWAELRVHVVAVVTVQFGRLAIDQNVAARCMHGSQPKPNLDAIDDACCDPIGVTT